MIYVDDMRLPARVGRYQAQWSHLVSDSADLAELHRFAESIGLRRAWFQDHPVLPHYDVTEGKRRQALAAGALEVTYPAGTADVLERRRAALAASGAAGGAGAPVPASASEVGPRYRPGGAGRCRAGGG